jgi:hypothetical protein
MRTIALVILLAGTAFGGVVFYDQQGAVVGWVPGTTEVAPDGLSRLVVTEAVKAWMDDNATKPLRVVDGVVVLAKTDRATAQSELYAAEWELIKGLYQFAGPSVAGVDPTGSALENMRKIKSYGDNLPEDSPLKLWATAQGAYLQGLWAWCERERTKLGVTVGYGERYISQ